MKKLLSSSNILVLAFVFTIIWLAHSNKLQQEQNKQLTNQLLLMNKKIDEINMALVHSDKRLTKIKNDIVRIENRFSPNFQALAAVNNHE